MSWLEEITADKRPWPERMYDGPRKSIYGIPIPGIFRETPHRFVTQSPDERGAVEYVKEQLDKSGGKFSPEDLKVYEAYLNRRGIPLTNVIRLKDGGGNTVYRIVSSASPEFINDYFGLPQKRTSFWDAPWKEKISRFDNALTIGEMPIFGNVHPWDLIPSKALYASATRAFSPVLKVLGKVGAATKYINKIQGARVAAEKATKLYSKALKKAPMTTKIATGVAKQAGIIGGWTLADAATGGIATPVIDTLMYATPGQGKIGSTITRLMAQNSILGRIEAPPEEKYLLSDGTKIPSTFSEDPIAAIRASAGYPLIDKTYGSEIRERISKNPDVIRVISELIKQQYPLTTHSEDFINRINEVTNDK